MTVNRISIRWSSVWRMSCAAAHPATAPTPIPAAVTHPSWVRPLPTSKVPRWMVARIAAKATSAVPSLKRLSFSTMVRSRAGARTLRKVAMTAMVSVAARIAPTRSATSPGSPSPKWRMPPATKTVRKTPGTASSTTGQTSLRRRRRSVEIAASNSRTGRKTWMTTSGSRPIWGKACRPVSAAPTTTSAML